MFIVYKVVSPSNKIYIGITSTSLKKRKNKHIYSAKTFSRTSKFQKAILKYGDNLIWEVIDKTTTLEHCLELEKYYIIKYKSFTEGYNSTLGGESLFGFRHSEKTKQLMSTKAKNRKFTLEHKKKLSLAQINHKSSLNVRNQMALAHGGRPFHVYKDDKLVNTYICRNTCARELNVQRSNILKVLKGQRSHTGGYMFIYVENVNG